MSESELECVTSCEAPSTRAAQAQSVESKAGYSRRRFFLNAALGPLIAASAVSAFGGQTKPRSTQTKPLGCNPVCQSMCQPGCEGSCEIGCQSDCEAICQIGCQMACEDACQYGCQATCELQCQGHCITGGSQSGCGGCQGVCIANCENTCQGACIYKCMNLCENACQDNCQLGCQSLYNIIYP